MPSYAKFLKEILSKKRRLENYETIALREECSAILQNKLPPKLKDPWSFSIPFLIGNKNIDKALCDLGASSVKYPIGILENIPIKVEKFFIPIDFIFLEMEEDIQIPIILGRPFLATAGAIIDVKNKWLTLKVRDEEAEFNLFRIMKHKLEPDEYLKVDIIDKLVKEEFHKRHTEGPLEAFIVHDRTTDSKNTEIAACAKSLKAIPPLPLAQAFQVEELKEEQPKSKSHKDTK
ncbi:uncharacterized protein LOC131183180 [Hevea brasiliensis]|uniref:uncharacterized protein LOC131183180 n=1 Tax=Hevea brasiliensis TaxID=3981 RepID=UPI0025E35238|nr:uncharacterized protein LOC131183180 [Hevea brasiliensis]